MDEHRRTILPSGVRVITQHLPGQRSVTAGAWIGVGSRHEPEELAGAAHFLEHMLFKGTPARSALRIAQDFDAVGGDLNAFTTKEFTCIHGRVLGEDLPMTLETMADMVANATLAPEDVESERAVVIDEIAMHEDTPDDAAYDACHELLWPGNPLGRRIHGDASRVRAITREQLAAFHAAGHGSAPLVVSAAGNVDHDAVVDLVARLFGERPAPREAVWAIPDVAPGGLSAVVRDLEQVHVVYGTTGIPRGDERRWPLSILNVALGGGMSSRLFQEIRERRGLAYAIASGHQAFSDAGAFTVYAGCSADHVGEVLSITRDQIAAVVQEGITEEELRRAVGHVRGSLISSLDEAASLMSHIGKSELCLRRTLTTQEMIDRVEAVTLGDVHAIARELLAGKPWSLSVLGPAVPVDMTAFVGEAA